MAVRDELEFEGFAVEVVQDGGVALESILRSPPHLVVLDLMLPGRNGFEVCSDMRKRGITTPVVIVTARGHEADKVRGLDLGADDYVTKPFSLAELVARIRAVLRRYEQQATPDVIQHGAIAVDVKKRQTLKSDTPIELTEKEFQILTFLMNRPGEVVTRDEFLKEIWGEDVYVTPRTVDIHIAALRRKLEDNPEKPAYILSVRNVGYKFNA
ncbi:MAG: response regulator transcription factor [Acidobacteria bacterium]|nr:response regulator transcription factor [Acidobacteriota bacterium]